MLLVMNLLTTLRAELLVRDSHSREVTFYDNVGDAFIFVISCFTMWSVFFFAFLAHLSLSGVFKSRITAEENREAHAKIDALHSILTDYEILPISDLQLHSVRKRDVHPLSHLERMVKFRALQRNFKLYLTTSTYLFSDNFKAVFVDKLGRKENFNVQRQNYFTGHVVGDENSRVQAHIDGDEFSARILSDGAEYNVEPLWRFTNNPDDDRLLVYRSEDIKNLSRIASPKVCAYLHAKDLLPEITDEINDFHYKEKRRVYYDHNKNTCPLLLVADYRFFRHMGHGKESVALNYLIELIDRIDDIFRNTAWDHKFKGYGVQIQEIIIHKEPTKPPPRGALTDWTHYNMENSPVQGEEVWNIDKLINQFKGDIADSASTVCLAHLFTYQDFENGTLGYAYVGGLCPIPFIEPVKMVIRYNNIGFTTTKNYGKTILTKAYLVTAHELGHNFGAVHDPDDVPHCAPSHDKGGKFLMYGIAGSGDDVNNKCFSSCSKIAILKMLRARVKMCFKERNRKSCGNSRVEEDEDCDPGVSHPNDDACCLSSCKFKPGSQCSDRNSPCCNKCRFKQAGTRCQEPISATCKGIAFCTGNSSECPRPENAVDDSVCVDNGVCRKGECNSFCEAVQNLQSCACNTIADSCKVCCRTKDGTCAPFVQSNGNFLFLQRGKPCTVGFCDENGKCMKQVQDFIKRFWDFIGKLDINTFGKFLADNIVGSVVVFSLIFWIPLSILVHGVDKNLDLLYEQNAMSPFRPVNQENLNIIQSPQPPPSSSSDGPTTSLPRPRQAWAATVSHPAPGPSYVPTPDCGSGSGLRTATIQEDNSSDSHAGEEAGRADDFPTAGAHLLTTTSRI
ncbi:disintegrin and metalloproteinase domain-containing protein 17-like isoform X2 [Festucalex cinctus]